MEDSVVLRKPGIYPRANEPLGPRARVRDVSRPRDDVRPFNDPVSAPGVVFAPQGLPRRKVGDRSFSLTGTGRVCLFFKHGRADDRVRWTGSSRASSRFPH